MNASFTWSFVKPQTVLEKVDDLLLGDIDYGGALVEEASHVLA
jgi:hypothetical protein